MKCTMYNLQFKIVLLALALHGTALYGENEAKHYIDLHAGGGVSHWNYPLEGGALSLGAAFSAGIGYTWFFRPFVGLQTGLSFTGINSYATLQAPFTWAANADGTPLVDYMGEAYVHRATPNDCREAEQAYLLEVPLGLRFRYFPSPDSRAGLHAAMGAKLAIPVLASYKPISGTVTHTGWYEQWQLELRDLPGRFATESFGTMRENSIRDRLNTINAEVYAELGAAFRLSPHCEMFVAAFGQYMVNNFAANTSNRNAIGFRTAQNNYAFMLEYTGVVGSDRTGAIHPWSAGVKAGISIWPGKTEKEKQKQLKELLKLFPENTPVKEVHDTIYLHDTIYINPSSLASNPSSLASNPSPLSSLDSLLSEAVIWFPYDKYVPILEPAYILDSVAAMMHRYPDLKIHVNGHACRLGTDRYNKRLALLRAQTIADMLKRKGIPANRMYVWSYGEKHPYRYNSRKQLSKDRRVEIIPEIHK